jgi:hypothetical protein
MTKLVSLRVVVAADDSVELKDLKARLTTVVSDVGTETLGENGAGGRVHWGTVEVLQGPDRVPLRKAAGGRRTATTGQGELA